MKTFLDLILDTDSIENIDETSPEFEPLTSVLDNENSNDESISGMSDLVSVGSPVQIASKEINDTNSNGFEIDKNSIKKLQQTFHDKNGITNHKFSNTNNELNHNNIISHNAEKLKTNDLKSKSKHSSGTSGQTNSQNKTSSHKSKDRNSINHRSSSREKNDIKKKSNNDPKEKKNSSHSKHHSDSKNKDKKSKHKKSRYTDHDKTSKRDRKESRSDKKEKSSSLCKEPKSLNGNRSDDDNNAGGSSKQKSSIHKNKSSTSDKSKSSSSNHKSSRKDNGSKDVVDKLKDKSSMSSSSCKSSRKNNHANKKRLVCTLEKPTNNLNNIENHSKSSNYNSSMTNDDQDAANILLSMSVTPFEISCNEAKTENIIFVQNSITNETLITPTDVTENKLEVKENVDQLKIMLSNNIDNTKENINLITNNLELLQSYDSDELSLNFRDVKPKLDPLEVENTLSSKTGNLELSFNESTEKDSKHKHVELVVDKNKDEKNDKAIFNQITKQHDPCTVLTVSKLKLKLLPNQIDAIKRKRHSKITKSITKKIKLLNTASEVNVPVVDNMPSSITCKQNDDKFKNEKPNCDSNAKINTSSIEILEEDHENHIVQIMNDELLPQDFKGYSLADVVSCKNRERLINIIKTLQIEEKKRNVVYNDGFKGFNNVICNRFNVSSELKKLKKKIGSFKKHIQTYDESELGFKGFTEEQVKVCKRYYYVKNQLELAKKQINMINQQNTIVDSRNGIQSENKINNVMIVYNNDISNAIQNDNYNQPDNSNKKDCPVINNNNHDMTPSDNWVVEQEMKYKLLPVKVKLERLMEYRCSEYYI